MVITELFLHHSPAFKYFKQKAKALQLRFKKVLKNQTTKVFDRL